MIKIKNLKLSFSGRMNLAIDNLFIEEGKIFSVIGPNGAGKTTLLNIISLFQKPDSGSIKIWDKNILDTKDAVAFRRKVSFIFSQPYLFSGTVYDNIALPLRLRGINDVKSIDQMLGLFKIGHLKSNVAKTLSQGEKYRLSLARAFVSRPEIVLLDEPFLSLDIPFKESIMHDLRKIIKSSKITAMLVTQDQKEALAFADTLAVMINGRILQQSIPLDVFSRPASKEVADFVGVETIAEGTIFKKEDNLCYVKIKDRVVEVVSAYNLGDDVFVCIRPQDLVVSKHPDINSARNHFQARIISIEPYQLEYRLYLDCGFNLIASVTKQSIENLGLKVDNNIFVSFKATAIHLIKR